MSQTIVFETLVLGAVGLLAGRPLAKWSAERSAKQPILLAVDEERRLIAEIIFDPKSYAVVSELNCEDFAVLAHRRIWEEIKTVGDDALDGATAVDEEQLAEVQALLVNVSFDDALGQLDDEAKAVADSLRAVEGVGDLTSGEVLDLGMKVLASYDDRTRVAGAVPPLPGDEGEPPFVRRVREPSRVRVAATCLMAAVALAAIPYLVSQTIGHSVVGSLFCGTALFLLGITSIEIALVDFDTYYVDYPVLAVGGGAAWLATVGAALVTHRASVLLAGLIAVVAFGFFEAMNFFYRRVRHQHGMGYGDSMLLLVVIGIPSALTGSPRLGWYALIVSLLGAVAVQLPRMMSGRGERGTPFALAPYLALGWLPTWLLISALTN
jgi:prepilin signal peptidase PulO-like enzyme (type II secretory pathway)